MKKHKIFKTNPNLKEVHMTSDGEAFYNDNDAKMHAKTLQDKAVELVVNPSLIEESIVDDSDDEEFEVIDQSQTGEAIRQQMLGISAKPDGSENVLVVTGDSPQVEASENDSTEVEAPENDSPEVEAPEVETPEVETKTVTTKKGK